MTYPYYCMTCDKWIFADLMPHECSVYSRTISDSTTPMKIMTSEMPITATKYDQGKAIKSDSEKVDLSLLPRNGKIGIAKAFMYGAKKYKRFNFLKGMEWSRVIAACDRHMTDFNSGIDLDEESNLNHLYHAGACIMMLIEYYERNVGTDDRYKDTK